MTRLRQLRDTFAAERGPRFAVAAALVLLAIGLLMALLNERGHRANQADEITIQAHIVAASIAPALLFDDVQTAQEYLEALAANPDIEAAAIYKADGTRFAALEHGAASPPLALAEASPPRFEENALAIASPVTRDSEALGWLYLQVAADPPLRRISQYVGAGVLVLLATMVLTVFGFAQGLLSKANAALSERAQALQREIAQRQEAEEALLQSRKLEAIGQLTGGVAHDFNNLLMVVLGGLSMLEKQEDPARRARTLEAMRQAAERGAALTRQLLVFARRQTLRLEAVDIAARLHGMRELLERSLRADILVDIVTPEDVWSAQTDPAQLELAVLNLAVNARDAMPNGGMLTLTARNATRNGGDWVEIDVRDSGEGMSQEVQRRALEPFFTTKEPGRGTGLGLSQVYGIARQSGGDLRIESAPGHGTCVTIILPRCEDARPAAEAAGPRAGRRETLAGLSILVVEDDERVATAVLAMLDELGARTTLARNADEALAAVDADRRARFDLVFCDIIMPGPMNGVEFARELARRRPDLPLCLTSGFSDTPLAGVEAPLLRKPYDLDQLNAFLQAAVAKANAVPG